MSKVKKIATLSLGQGINVIVYFLFLPYMARVLTYEDYGTYGQVLLIGSFAIVLFSFGLSRIIYVYLSKAEQEGKVLFSNLSAGLFSGFFAAAVLYFSAGFFAAWLDNPGLELPMKYYAVAAFFVIPFSSVNAFLIFKDKVRQSVIISVVSNLIKILLVVYFVQMYASVSLALAGIAFAFFVQFAMGLWYIRKDLHLAFSMQLFKEQLLKGMPLGLTGILGTGILYIDGIMVSRMEGVEIFALYRNGALEVPYLATVYASVAAIILPEVAKLYSKHQFVEIVALKKKVIMNTMMLTYPVLVFLLFNARDLIVLYLGQKYEASAMIFAIFNLTLLVRVNDYSDILIASNKAKYIMYYYTLAFLLNIGLNYVLIQKLGMVGAAISTVFTLFVLSFAQLRKSMQLVDSKMIKLVNIKQILLFFLVSISLALVLDQLILRKIDGILKIGLFSLLYFSIIYSFLIKMNYLPKAFIKRIVPARVKKLLHKWD